ncbi:MAG: HD domain-containing protein, partial [Actinobacteria bacterium]
ARRLAERIQTEVIATSAAEGYPMTASVGIAAYPETARSSSEMLNCADQARQWAKAEGYGHVVVYDPSIARESAEEGSSPASAIETQIRTARSLAGAVDARDVNTRLHSANVSRLATQLGRALALDDKRVALLDLAATVHDIGKISIPDSVLLKPGTYNLADWRVMRRHPEFGVTILENRPEATILPWIRSHHERWDGTGYPDGLEGHQIPLESRILAVCDAYDAMVSDRLHRPRRSSQAALHEIDLNLGTQFDPVVGEAFIRLVSEMLANQEADRISFR